MDTLAPPLRPAPRSTAPAARAIARFDGRFFVGVTSTGVYCRPVCPAPSPRDAHVRYFPTAAAAGDAGFRPCLRCRPEAAPGTPAWLGTSAVVRRALALVHEGALDEGIGRRARRPARHRPAPPAPPVRRPRRRPAARRGEDPPPPLREAADRRDRPVHDRDRVRVGLRQPAPLQRHVPEDLRPRAERAAPAPAKGRHSRPRGDRAQPRVPPAVRPRPPARVSRRARDPGCRAGGREGLRPHARARRPGRSW